MPLDLFVSPTDTFDIEFVVCAAKSDPKVLYAEVSEEKLKEIYEDDVDETTIEKHTATFRRPSFEDMSRLYDAAFSFIGSEMKANASSVRINKMISLLKKWTLPRPANAEEIRRLNPIIAMVIGSELDRMTA